MRDKMEAVLNLHLVKLLGEGSKFKLSYSIFSILQSIYQSAKGEEAEGIPVTS